VTNRRGDIKSGINATKLCSHAGGQTGGMQSESTVGVLYRLLGVSRTRTQCLDSQQGAGAMGSRTPSEPYQRGETIPRERSPTHHGGDLPEVLRVERWTAMEQADDGRARFPASHRYVEILWTTRLGPMSVIVLRRLADVVLSDQPDVEVRELAVAIGTPGEPDKAVGRHSPLGKAIGRLVRFRHAGWMPAGSLAVVTQVPALGERDLARLPTKLRELHERLIDEQRPQP
jgi:hypothetical protein